MALAYTPPGTSVEELTAPSLAPLLALPGSVCLVGPASGSITRSETVQLVSNNWSTLSQLPLNSSLSASGIVSLKDIFNSNAAPSGFTLNTGGTNTPNGDFDFRSTQDAYGNTIYQIRRVVQTNTLATGQAVVQGATSVVLSDKTKLPPVGGILRISNSDTGLTETQEIKAVDSATGTLTLYGQGTLFAYAVNNTTVSFGKIPDADALTITYQYVPSDYFTPIRLTSMNDIQDRFGNAWTNDGTQINSPLSFAAALAFQNGASSLVLQPLFYEDDTTGTLHNSDVSHTYLPSTWGTTFDNLLGIEDINIIVPVVGQTATSGFAITDGGMLQIFSMAQKLIATSKTANSIYQVLILGEDSTAGPSLGSEQSVIGHAQSLGQTQPGLAEQIVLINATSFAVPNSSSYINVGGQYAAAAIAGMLSARSPSTTLTRRALSGFVRVNDGNRSQVSKNSDAQNGLFVIEQKGNVIQVRHSITLDNTSVARRELNVVRAKHYIIESVRNTIDSQVVGNIVADADAPTLVNNVVIATLEDLRGNGVLINYSGVQSRITSLDPTAMEIQFTYRPSFVVNYVRIKFSLDLTSGALTVGATSNQ